MIAKHKLFGIETDVPTTDRSGLAFNATSLAVPKGIYTVGGINYDCQEEGFYFFYDGAAGITLQRYIFGASSYPMTSSNTDPKKFLSALAYMRMSTDWLMTAYPLLQKPLNC